MANAKVKAFFYFLLLFNLVSNAAGNVSVLKRYTKFEICFFFLAESCLETYKILSSWDGMSEFVVKLVITVH